MMQQPVQYPRDDPRSPDYVSYLEWRVIDLTARLTEAQRVIQWAKTQVAGHA